MIKARIVFCIMLIFILLGCEKDRLKDNKEILIGTWSWVYSEHDFGACDNQQWNETLTPLSENKSFRIEFLKKGKVIFYENDVLTEEKRIVFDNFYYLTGYIFDIHLNNNEEDRLLGAVFEDSLYTWDFPFKSENPLCESYKNFFYKE